jgi:hypothetical protein
VAEPQRVAELVEHRGLEVHLARVGAPEPDHGMAVSKTTPVSREPPTQLMMVTALAPGSRGRTRYRRTRTASSARCWRWTRFSALAAGGRCRWSPGSRTRRWWTGSCGTWCANTREPTTPSSLARLPPPGFSRSHPGSPAGRQAPPIPPTRPDPPPRRAGVCPMSGGGRDVARRSEATQPGPALPPRARALPTTRWPPDRPSIAVPHALGPSR